MIFIDINTYILTEGTNSKIFLKENYAIALDSCYFLTKKMLNMELNMILIVLIGVCIHHIFLNFTADLMNTLHFKESSDD